MPGTGTFFGKLEVNLPIHPQEDVSLLMSHINSYTRKKLNDQSANQLFSFLYGADTLAKLGIKVIPANEINLTPYLLKK